MPVSPIPRGVYPSVTDIRPEDLAARGIRLVLADLDNTLAPYHVEEPAPEIIQWKDELEARGILPGLPVEGGILWCCTELNRKPQIDALIAAIREVLQDETAV